MYNSKDIEEKWQKQWDKDQLYKTPEHPKKKQYILDMFPYPSGAGLHVGHPIGYIATDILSRFTRMSGYDVLHPMGWDAFGLPAENYAIQSKVHPRITTRQNTDRFREQLKMIGLSYDWSHEINASDPEYYRWTQWLFLQFYKKGLAYKKEAYVNWCPKDQTVLANEQVIDGKCERCGTVVVQKLLSQWFFKITDYADRLLEGLEKLDWPKPIKLMQKNWIGRSEGAEIDFLLERKFKYVFLHGFDGSSKGSFWPWLINELENKKIQSLIFDLPNTNNPTEEEQVGFVLRNAQFDENTVIVGHSLGSVVGLKVIEKLRVKIAGYVAVGGFLEPKFKDHPRIFENSFKWNFDFNKIKANTGFRKVISDLNDEVVPAEQGRLLAKDLSGDLVETAAQKSHFQGRMEPAVMDAILPSIKVFTTRPDTLFGATYMVLAPEHPLVEQITTPEQKNYVINYVIETKKKTELQRTALEKIKTGVFTGAFTVNPATKEKIPVWIADYVLATYGTGAIMAVPAHDQRDREFAEKYKLPITDKPLLSVAEAIKKFGRAKVQYKLRDWLISRQRYWGAPIPIIYCENCGMSGEAGSASGGQMIPVPEEDLPVLLPTDVDFLPTGESPLARSKKFNQVKCPKCNGPARRDHDTMDTFVDSGWYFFRFTDPHNDKVFADKKKVKEWLPVDTYVGGADHAVLHLLYARFFTKALFDLKIVGFEEPFLKLRNQGNILGPDGTKMSKSRGNIVNPDEVVDQYGADSLRMYEMFMGPFEDAKPWSTTGIVGVKRFLDKVWRYQQVFEAGPDNKQIHKLVKKITSDIENFKFNTAVAAFMEFLNENKIMSKENWETFLILLAPFAPHITEELWQQLGHKESIHKQVWPKFDEKLTKEKMVAVVVQVLGRVRATLQVPSGSDQTVVKKLALADAKVKKNLEGKEIVREVFVQDKLINFVIK